MLCAKCKTENPDGLKFCNECGTPFKTPCASCAFENAPAAKFCGQCGAALGALAAKASAKQSDQTQIPLTDASENLEGERKTVSMLFADIKGSMSQIEDLDPEVARAIVDPALAIMAEAVNRYQGHVAQSTGDGVFALFGAPIAHEDHPQRAIYAAMRMQEELRRYSDRLRGEGKAPVEIRIGINTGEVVMRSVGKDQSHAEYLPAGHAVGLASRLQTIAPTGSIALSEHTRQLVEGYFQLKPLGPTRVKGVTEAVNVYEVLGLGPLRTRLQRSASRGFTKFVGRSREMDAMKAAADQAKAGRGQIVAAMAEPGVGKSRLFYEFKTTSQSGWMLLEAVSLSHDKASAYMPVVDLLSRYFEIEAQDDGRKRREKVAGKIAILDRALEDTLPYLYGLLGLIEGNDPLVGMDAPIRRQRTLEALKRILLRESFNQPLMVIFEDLHWIGEDTQAFLNLLADSIGTARLLLLVNYRPEYSHPWNSKTYYTQLRLDPLGGESAGEMLDALLGVRGQATDTSLAALKRLIIEKTEGTPLFIEEIYQSLIEEGALVHNGTVKLTRSLDALKIPPTVQDIIASRIDRLPAAEKELLQTLAVIGIEFPFGLACEIIKKPEDELTRMLNALQLAEFIYEQPAVGGVEYTFKHALTREVAYGSLLIERRRQLHEHVGRAVEALYADSLDDHLADLGHHFQRAGNAVEAVKYLHRAGTVTAAKSAFPEAISHLTAGLELVKTLPESPERARTEWDLLTGLTGCLSVTSGAGSSKRGEALMRMEELCGHLGDDARLFYVVSNRINFHGVRDELATERELSEQAVAIAERSNNAAFLENACSYLGYSLWKLGEFSAARKQLERAIAAPAAAHHRAGYAPAHFKMLAMANLAWVQWILGFPQQAVETSQDALNLVRTESTPGSLTFALIYCAELHRFVREPDKTGVLSAEALEIAKQSGFSLLEAQAKYEHGWSLIHGPQVAAGLAEMSSAMEALEATGAVASAWRAGPLAEAWSRSGNPERGLGLLCEAIVRIERTGERFYQAELRRLIGELSLACDPSNVEEPRRTFDKAIEVARLQNTKALELRAAVSLARLPGKDGERMEARARLYSIYDWFAEGFETPDLREARSLLDELGA